MTATADAAPADMSLFARALGVLTSPKATFERIVATPRPIGILLLVAVVLSLTVATPMFTAAGQQAVIESQAHARELAGRPMSPEEYTAMERIAPYFAYFTVAQVFIGMPIMCLIITALCWVAFNTVLGGAASFKQVLAVITHSQVVGAIGAAISAPIQFMQGTMTAGGPFNLGAIVPGLDETSTIATLLGATSVFTIWGLIVMAIGLAVLYKRKSLSVAIGLILAYAAIAYTLISVFSSMFGGQAGR